MNQPGHQDMIDAIEDKARHAVMYAAFHGHVLTIDMKPQGKLAMGSYLPEISLRPARSPNLMSRFSDWFAQYYFKSPRPQAAIKMAERYGERVVHALEGYAAKATQAEATVGAGSQFQLTENEIATLVQALAGQSAVICDTLAALEKERKRHGLEISRDAEWVAEQAMEKRLLQITQLAKQLETASTRGRVLLQYPQR